MRRTISFAGALAVASCNPEPVSTHTKLVEFTPANTLSPGECGCTKFDLECGVDLVLRSDGGQGQTLEEISAGVPAKETPRSKRITECLKMIPFQSSYVAAVSNLADEACGCSSYGCMVRVNEEFKEVQRVMGETDLDETTREDIVKHTMRLGRCAESYMPVKYGDR